MIMIKYITTVLSFSALLVCSLNSQVDLTSDRFDFDGDLPYSEAIQSPAEFLGYELGETFTLYAHAIDYFQYLAKQSDKISINHYGTTYEGRKLYNVVITSPDNHANIERIKAQNLELASGQSVKADDLIDDKPVFISYSYNIHGNEASGTEAALQVSYRLVAAEDAETQEILNNSVIIFYVCINPDGRDRYVYWYNGVQRNKIGIEPRDLEHYAPWPNGRTNHYWFDLNRDWIWGVHPESRGHTTEYQKWMPQIHVDYHEQGYNNNYFTMPGTTPRNQLLPNRYEPLTDTIGMANVRAFDQHKLNYFTREAFDFFYPGYGSSYPSVMSAIGMLTEQGGISAGRAVTTNDGYVLTLRQRIFDHFTTSIATIKKTVERKELFNKYSYEASQPERSKSSTQSYVLLDDGSIYLKEVLNILKSHGVHIDQTVSNSQLSNAYDYRSGQKSTVSIPQGSYHISTNQPRHLFINTVLSAQMAIEDSVMYDMSTWSAPIAYNLTAYSSDNSLNARTIPWNDNLEDKSTFVNADEAYGYLIPWGQRGAPAALSALWSKGYKVRMAEEGFADEERNYDPGTLIILDGRNLHKNDVIGDDMNAISSEYDVNIYSVRSGRMRSGGDLASRKSQVLNQPKVALLVEPPFSTYTCGQLYFLFDVDSELPVERIRTSILEQSSVPKFGSRYGLADLNDYDVLLLAGGGNHLSKVFNKEDQKKLKEWIQAGGTIVATESAVDFFTKDKSGLTGIELSSPARDTSIASKYLKYSDREAYRGKKRVPGAALRGQIDNSHPLAFGMSQDLYTLCFRSSAFKPSSSFATVGHYHKNAQDLLASGYASQDNLDHLAGKTFAAVQNMGRGKIVLLSNNTQYRMFWRGPSRMMQNAVMILPSF